MIIVQVTNFKVTGMYNLPLIPSEFLGYMGTIYHNLENNPSGVDIDWRYEGGDFLPPLDTSSSFGRIITVLAYRHRFTQPERIAIKMAAQGQVEGITPVQAATIASDLDDLLAADYVDLDNPATIIGAYSLESAGLLTAGRALEILSPLAYSIELRTETRGVLGLSHTATAKEVLVNGGKGYRTVSEYFKENPKVPS